MSTSLQEMFSSGVMTLISDFVMVVWIVGIMFYLHAELALVSLALIPPMAFAINFFRVKARQTYRLIRERIARINAYLGEAISGMASFNCLPARRRPIGSSTSSMPTIATLIIFQTSMKRRFIRWSKPPAR